MVLSKILSSFRIVAVLESTFGAVLVDCHALSCAKARNDGKGALLSNEDSRFVGDFRGSWDSRIVEIESGLCEFCGAKSLAVGFG